MNESQQMNYKKPIATAALSLALAASPAFAGNMTAPDMEMAVEPIMEEATSSSSAGGILVPLLFLLLIGAAVGGSSSGGGSPPIY